MLILEELCIKTLKNVFNLKLEIPIYQRAYSWSQKATNMLFSDIYKAFKNKVKEYRIGSVILHKNLGDKGSTEYTYNIIDGQQRLTTVAILLFILEYKEQSLLNEKYEISSYNKILENFELLGRRVSELTKEEQEVFQKYILENCTVVQIVTDNEQEAFQFFDSQNSRGKELAAHDLLKSYHLREMKNENEQEKLKIISQWEAIPQNELDDLFKNYLYPIIKWNKKENGLGYGINEIDFFKGIKVDNKYNYAIYHKASNIYIDQFNTNGNNELFSLELLNKFQLTQPLIAGKRFFEYTFNYKKLLEVTINRIEEIFTMEEILDKRLGDKYIKNLYICSLMVFIDRFNIESLNDFVMKRLYLWSYSLRLTMNSVYPQTINKYAVGRHERINEGLAMFSKISEMQYPEDLKLLILKEPNIIEDNKTRYEKIYKLFCRGNGWNFDE